MQTYDKEVSEALETLLKSGPRSLTKGLEEWNLEDGVILFQGQVYVPRDKELQREIIKKYHSHITIGHPGRWKTYELISRDFWWPGMSTFVKSFVDGCATCQATKIKPRTKVPLQPNLIPTRVWETITMDFITDLPVCNATAGVIVRRAFESEFFVE